MIVIAEMDSLSKTRDWLKSLYAAGFKFPNTYMVLDVETTGLSINEDLIVQIASLFVEDGQITCPAKAHVLNWIDYQAINQDWLKERMLKTRDNIVQSGSHYKFSYDGLSVGVEPVKAFKTYLETIKKWQANGWHFVMHNGYRYDTGILENHFKRVLGENFIFDTNKLIDTGLFEKGSQLNYSVLPEGQEALAKFYSRISSYRARGLLWSLTKHCIPKYKLAEKHNLSVDGAHSADFDCHSTHLLYQTYRNLAMDLE